MISTHVLDTATGRPAANVSVKLEIIEAGKPRELAVERTNADGRIVYDCEKKAGIYQLTFEIEDYLKKNSKDYFFLVAPVRFKIEDTKRKYHVPLLLNPFGYSTYRGS